MLLRSLLSGDLRSFLIALCLMLPAVVICLTVHECAHGLAARALGDRTAERAGRLTLDPLAHIDPLGFLCMLLLGFGWARPVPINSANFKNYKVGLFTTAIAGVVTNYIIAFIFYPLYALSYMYVGTGTAGGLFLTTFLWLGFCYNLSIAVFNLLPLFPLDGFRVVESLTGPWNKVRQFLGKYGQTILLVLVFESFICRVAGSFYPIFESFDVLGYVMTFAVDIIGWPIQALWGLII